MSIVNIGIIGAGRIGKLHTDNLVNMEGVRVKTIADPYADKLKEWFETKDVDNLVKDYKEVMEDDEIDAVFICTPTDTHLTLIEECLAHNKHIFCEKPISFDQDETERVYELVKNSNKKVQIGFNRRFDQSFSSVEKDVSSDKLGTPQIIKITSRDPEPPSLDYVKTSGGLYFDMAIHDFDMARFLSKSEVKEIYATGEALINPQIKEYDDIDTSMVTLKFENNAIGVIDNSRQAVYGYDQRIEVFGHKGMTLADNQKETTVKHFSEENVSEDKPLFFFLERYNDAFIVEVKEFVKSIQEDLPTSPSYEDGMKAQALAHAAKKSLAEGRPIKL